MNLLRRIGRRLWRWPACIGKISRCTEMVRQSTQTHYNCPKALLDVTMAWNKQLILLRMHINSAMAYNLHPNGDREQPPQEFRR